MNKSLTIRINNQILNKEVDYNTPVEELYSQLAQELGYEAGSFSLFAAGSELDSEFSLEQQQVLSGDVLDLGLDIDGGKKKKKKRVYKTPKVIKHRHKNQKLKVLTYYEIQSDGTVTHTKMKTPYPLPGRVSFMAKHHDRHYCGRSHVCLKINDGDAAAAGQKKGGKKK